MERSGHNRGGSDGRTSGDRGGPLLIFDEFVDTPAHLALRLREHVFGTQKRAADELALDAGTISRYETGGLRLAMGYIALLVVRLAELEAASDPDQRDQVSGPPLPGSYADLLLRRTNEIITRSPAYGLPSRFRNWEDMRRKAADYEREAQLRRERRASQPSAGPTSNEGPPSNAPAVESPEAPARRAPLARWLVPAGVLTAATLIFGLVVVAAWWLTMPGGQNEREGEQPTATVRAGAPCGSKQAVEAPNAFRFLRPAGVIAYGPEGSDGAILGNKARSVAIDARGVWIGYYSGEPVAGKGVGQFDGKRWADCEAPGEGAARNINSIAVDARGRVWAAAEEGGVLMYDGSGWRAYTRRDGLPSTNTFSIEIDPVGNVWASTWEGAAKYDERSDAWSVPYAEGSSVLSKHTHALGFQQNGDIWVGHLGKGVSHYNNATGRWEYHSKAKGELGSDDVFDIVVQKASAGGAPEAVWFATSGGLSKYEEGKWSTYHTGDGLPDDRTQGLAIDRYNRLWAATEGGVVYRDGTTWVTYHKIPSLALAFGPECSGCPYSTDAVWTGTASQGLTYSRLPYPLDAQVIDVVSVRYRKVDTPDAAFSDSIALAPGEKLVAQIVVSPRNPFTLTQERGDLLSSIEEDDQARFGAYPHIVVKGTVESGQRHTFTDFDNPFVAPSLPDGEDEKQYTTRYRVWMHTRYVGPVIEVKFTVRRPGAPSGP